MYNNITVSWNNIIWFSLVFTLFSALLNRIVFLFNKVVADDKIKDLFINIGIISFLLGIFLFISKLVFGDVNLLGVLLGIIFIIIIRFTKILENFGGIITGTLVGGVYDFNYGIFIGFISGLLLYIITIILDFDDESDFLLYFILTAIATALIVSPWEKQLSFSTENDIIKMIKNVISPVIFSSVAGLIAGNYALNAFYESSKVIDEELGGMYVIIITSLFLGRILIIPDIPFNTSDNIIVIIILVLIITYVSYLFLSFFGFISGWLFTSIYSFAFKLFSISDHFFRLLLILLFHKKNLCRNCLHYSLPLKSKYENGNRLCEFCNSIIERDLEIIRRVIGFIGSNIEDAIVELNTYNINLWNDKDKESKFAQIDELYIYSEKKVKSYDWAINAVYLKLVNDVKLPRGWLKNIPVYIKGGIDISDNIISMLKREFKEVIWIRN